MSNLPEPLTPRDADLQDFPFMPLQVARLRDSDLAAEENPESCWYAVLLWGAAWHQIPAGSLPDNDTVLMRLVGLGRDARTWKRHRAGALRGFIKCSDGRLYHPVVAEQVAEGWLGKLRQRHRTFCAAIRKHNERNPAAKRDAPDFDAWLSQGRPDKVTRDIPLLSHVTPPENECDIGSKGQGQGQGQGQSKEEDSEANASGDKPPSITAAEITKSVWDTGKAILKAAGHDDRSAGSIIGRFRKTYSDSHVLVVLSRCQVEQPSEPIEWITKALQSETRNGQHNDIRQGGGASPDRRSSLDRAIDEGLLNLQ